MFWMIIPTHIQLSVTLTLLLCNTISFLETWSFLALLIWRTTLVLNIGAQTDSIKNALMSWVITSGSNNCNVSTALSQGLSTNEVKSRLQRGLLMFQPLVTDISSTMWGIHHLILCQVNKHVYSTLWLVWVTVREDELMDSLFHFQVIV